jgi:hypothetical protein
MEGGKEIKSSLERERDRERKREREAGARFTNV